MTKAIVVSQHGGPETLVWQDVWIGDPGPDEVRVRHTAIGLNFIDVYFRTGLYPPPALPFTPGMEAAGVIEAVGESVTDLAVGDRVAYACPPPGSYTERRVLPAWRVVKLPDAIDDQTAAAIMLKGMTAQYLLRQTYPVQAGETVLVHAAAGGVGLLACQWAKHLGATVIGTVGSEDKAELAKANGCDHPILYRNEDFVARVKAITNGRGVDVVYDSVGADTFLKSLDCLRKRGMLVSFGQSSGPVEPLNVGELSAKGSLYLTRPTLFHYTDTPEALRATTDDLFKVISEGVVKVEIGQRFPLQNAADAHRALEGRETVGATVLEP